jgi:hypothetical protein
VDDLRSDEQADQSKSNRRRQEAKPQRREDAEKRRETTRGRKLPRDEFKNWNFPGPRNQGQAALKTCVLILRSDGPSADPGELQSLSVVFCGFLWFSVVSPGFLCVSLRPLRLRGDQLFRGDQSFRGDQLFRDDPS